MSKFTLHPVRACSWNDNSSLLLRQSNADGIRMIDYLKDYQILDTIASPSGRYVYFLQANGMIALDLFCGILIDFDDFKVKFKDIGRLDSYIPIDDNEGWLFVYKGQHKYPLFYYESELWNSHYVAYRITINLLTRRIRIRNRVTLFDISANTLRGREVYADNNALFTATPPIGEDGIPHLLQFSNGAVERINFVDEHFGVRRSLFAARIHENCLYGFEQKREYNNLAALCKMFGRLVKYDFVEGEEGMMVSAERENVELETDLQCLGIGKRTLNKSTFAWRIDYKWCDDRLYLLLNVEKSARKMHINYQKKAREPLKYSWSVHLGVFSFETMKWQQLELQKNSIPLKQSPLSMHIANDVMILVESGLEQRIVCNESPSQVRPFVLRTDLRRAFDYQHGAEMSKAYRIPLRTPESFYNLAQFAVSLNFPKWARLDDGKRHRLLGNRQQYSPVATGPYRTHYKVMTRAAVKRAYPF